MDSEGHQPGKGNEIKEERSASKPPGIFLTCSQSPSWKKRAGEGTSWRKKLEGERGGGKSHPYLKHPKMSAVLPEKALNKVGGEKGPCPPGEAGHH